MTRSAVPYLNTSLTVVVRDGKVFLGNGKVDLKLNQTFNMGMRPVSKPTIFPDGLVDLIKDSGRLEGVITCDSQHCDFCTSFQKRNIIDQKMPSALK